jgi:16S rRNA (adenine1518-N6/adenine1519-N6)-dimethyltransferase
VKTCRALFQHKKKKSGKALYNLSTKFGYGYCTWHYPESNFTIDNKLIEERVFKLNPAEILMISTQLEDAMEKLL